MQEKLYQKAKALKVLPGVYLMKDIYGGIIYIGKSKALRNRVSSYFLPSNKVSKVRRMVHHIKDFEVIYTDTELEALLLECRLIKSHQPIYNKLLKKQNRYRYLKVNKQAEKVSIVRENSGSNCYGPYKKGELLYSAIEVLNDFYKSNSFLEVEVFLKGQDMSIVNYYYEKMKKASETLKFEVALSYKKKWESLIYLNSREEALQFAKEPKLTLLKQPCPRGGYKVSVWYGIKCVWSNWFEEDGISLEPYKEILLSSYKEAVMQYSITSEDIDEIQIVYSAFKREDMKVEIEAKEVEKEPNRLYKGWSGLL